MFFGSQKIAHFKVNFSQLNSGTRIPRMEINPLTKFESFEHMFFCVVQQSLCVAGNSVHDISCRLREKIPTFFGNANSLLGCLEF
jgi:hypothetical protein